MIVAQTDGIVGNLAIREQNKARERQKRILESNFKLASKLEHIITRPSRYKQDTSAYQKYTKSRHPRLVSKRVRDQQRIEEENRAMHKKLSSIYNHKNPSNARPVSAR